ncbi:cell division control protein, putative [Theileria annulata]|uniref:DNA replication licensing factor MCM4 n=1 Tax=Theileria annulata TaxID=5874 RepID=Q4UAM8_THEAN|nr:cell division control protein, putative [Theileria annulata]CAI76123.1 cell division control protein, putative [Theileria annulata]|eukprot:XP_952749.1 cell division control protein, putative [Theileria annulata]
MDFTPRSRQVLSGRVDSLRPDSQVFNPNNTRDLSNNETQYTMYGKTPNLVRRIRNARNDIGDLGRETFMDQRDVARLPFLLDNRLEELSERFTNFLKNFTEFEAPVESKDEQQNKPATTELYYLVKLMNFIKENLRDHSTGYSRFLPFEVDLMHVYSFDLVLYKLLVTFPADCIAELDKVLVKLFNELLSKHYSDLSLENNSFFPRARLMNKPVSDCVGNLEPSMADSLVQFSGTVVRQTWIVPEITMACFRCRGQKKLGLNDIQPCTCEHYEYVIQGEVNEPLLCNECHSKYTFELNHNMCVYSTKKIVKLLQSNSSTNNPDKDGLDNSVDDNSGLNGEIYMKDNEVINLNLYDDLIDSVITGDRVTVVGILKVTPIRTSTTRRTLKSLYTYFVNVIHVKVINSTNANQPTKGLKYLGNENDFSDLQVYRILELSRNPMIYRILLDSFAPSIKARNNVKIGLLCQLFSSNANSSDTNKSPDACYKVDNFRGIINVLLCGDPGTAKSQLLHYTHLLSPRSIYTSGKSSSSVGLTASIKFNESDNGRAMIQPGAVVLANGGVCCIDELDKCHNESRLSLYEVMEQQTVTIAKAGIVATLKAETAILASCNPINSRYNKNKAVIENINISPSLFTRFDLIYLVLDHIDQDTDQLISLSIARDFLLPHMTGASDSFDTYDRSNTMHVESEMLRSEKDYNMNDLDMMRMYIKFSKLHCFPKLSDEAKKVITREYVKMRQGNFQTSNLDELEHAQEDDDDDLYYQSSGTRMIYVSSRMISSIIRIAVSLARMRLSTLVTKADALQAVQIVKSSTFQSLVDPTTGKIDFDQLHQGITTNKMQQLNQMYEQVLSVLTRSSNQDSNKSLDLNEVLNLLNKDFKDVYDHKDGEIYKLISDVLNKMVQEGTAVRENNSYRLKKIFS